MATVKIECALPEEDRALLRAVAKALGSKAGVAAKAAAGKSGKGAKADAEEDDGADAEDDDADAEDDDAGEDDDDAGEDDDADAEDDDAADEPPKPDQAAVRKAMRNYANVTNQNLAMKVLKEVGGVDALSKLKPAKFKAVIDMCNKKTKAKKAASGK